jgi:hypothetical protein
MRDGHGGNLILALPPEGAGERSTKLALSCVNPAAAWCFVALCRPASQEFQHKQLLHMSERLRKNQLMFDAHIKSMEDALRAGRKELTDVTGYLRQASQ